MVKSFWADVFDVISWLILIFIIIYGILKLTGIINSIDWIVVVGASIVVGRYMQKIDSIVRDVEGIKKSCPNFPNH